jgi:hypothetical protein
MDGLRDFPIRAAVLSAIATLAGCAASPPGDGRARTVDVCARPGWVTQQMQSIQGEQPPPVQVNNVRFLTRGLDKAVIVRSLDAAPGAAGAMTVSVHFLNCTEQRIVLAARTSFLDSDRFPLGAPTAWQRVYLAPSATAFYTERTIGGETVANYFVEVRDDGGSQ